METSQIGSTAGSSAKQQHVVLEVDNAIATIRLGSPDEKVILLTKERLESLSSALKEIRNEKSLKGLIIAGTNPRLFCAGADVNAIRTVSDPLVGKELATRGQEIFSEIERLHFPSIAAISGACVGGGCELVLACKWRILSDIPETKIGLPEIKLGILPGFGGTQRLPRLIGLRRALEIILKGQVVPARRAFDIGLADKLLPSSAYGKDLDAMQAALEKVAEDVLLGKVHLERKALGWVDKLLTYTGAGRSIVAKKSRPVIAKETKGNYPAPPRALDTVLYGLQNGEKAGYVEEARALGELIVTPQSKALCHIFFLTEDATRIGRSVKIDPSEVSVGVVGGGVMGAGIAASFLVAGAKVAIVEPSAQARDKARSSIQTAVEKRRGLSDAQKQELLSRLSIAEQVETLAASTLVVEAIVEDLRTKQDLFRKLSEVVSEKCILATNTSSLSVNQIALAVTKPERFIGMHFFNPVEKMPLVEVIQGENSSDRTIATTAALVVLLGKYPVVVTDVAGFLVNRSLSPYLLEAGYLLAEGYSPEEIDAAALKFGMPMGPIRLLDEIGLDVAAKVADGMEKTYGKRMFGPKYSVELVNRKRLGRKSGAGFYKYENGEAKPDPALNALLGLKSHPEQRMTPEDLGNRLILPMLNEAVRCLDEGVAGVPGKEAAGQIDMATVMGLGFAPFRGGILHFADSVTAKTLFETLTESATRYGERFQPAPGIETRAKSGQKFSEKTSLPH